MVDRGVGADRRSGQVAPAEAVATFGRHHSGSRAMNTARLFQSGRSQAVRLPKAYRFRGTEVIVKHFGNGVLLLPIEDPWQSLEAGLAAFESGFELRREQSEPQQRPEPAGHLGDQQPP